MITSLAFPLMFENAVPETDNDGRIRDLVCALKNGDVKAFAELYDRYAAALFGVIGRIVNSNECAEDVLQETFIKISRSISTYDEDKGRLFTWMAKTARNTAIDLLRSRGQINSRKTDDLDTLAEDAAQRQFSMYNPEFIGIRQLTWTLPENQKTILDLVYFKGYSHSEAAKILDIPIGTVKTRIRLAILTLRKCFN